MQDYRLQVRTRGGKREYRILNASRQVVAQGVLNCSEDNHEKDLKKIAKLIAEVWKTEDEAPIMSRGSYGHDTAWYIRQLRKLGYKDEISAEDFNEAWDMAARKEDLDSGCHGENKLNSSTIWGAKYKTVDGTVKKVYFTLDSKDFRDAEEELDALITEPYTKATVLGTYDNEASLIKDGFTSLNSAVGTSFDAMGFEMIATGSKSRASDALDELADIFEEKFPDEFSGPFAGTVSTHMRQVDGPEAPTFSVVFRFDTVGIDADDMEEAITDLVYNLNQHFQRLSAADEEEAVFVDIVDVFED